ncbi:plexin-D1 [Ambystoma mexicanum]|uniref:plexin-D1 n=1 Tax=Ambystoma mexicanum TaxID=8296 RepID=UPI0037E7BFEE
MAPPGTSNQVPLLPSLLLLLATHGGLGLEVFQKFLSPFPTNNFALDVLYDKVYLATVNRVFQLHGNLSKELEEVTGPRSDNPLCHAPQLPQTTCEHPKAMMDNYNKILELDQGQRVVVVCGSIYQGFCELRKMGNISEAAVSFPPQSDDHVTVFPSMLNVAANHPNASTVGLVLRNSEGDTRLLVGATYTGYGSPFFPKNQSIEDHRFENTPEIAIRSLNAKDVSKLFTFDINPSDDNIFKIKQLSKEKNKLSFLQAFKLKTYVYLAMNSDANLRGKESSSNSLLARICLDTREEKSPPLEIKKLTESYIQLGLRCGAKGDVFNRLVSVFAATEPQELLFGIFEKADRQSALCVFRFSDIEVNIRQARSRCFESPNLDEVTVLDSVVQGTGPHCQKMNINLSPEQLDCGAAHLQHPLAIMEPLAATPVFRAMGLTSVAVSSVNNHTIVFLGTSSGWLLKLNLNSSTSVVNTKSIPVAPGQPVHHVMHFDPSDANFLYLMTSYQMSRVKVANCEQHSTCSECLAAADAYCGWCTMEARCSLQQDCRNSSEPMHWTSISEGQQRCPYLTIIPAEISIDKEKPLIFMNIDGSIPNLKGTRMSCDYGNDIVTELKTRVLSQDRQQVAACHALPREKYPAFQQKQDHVTVRTAVKVNGVNIVWTDLNIYDCKRIGEINPKTACSSCLSSRWNCYWCVEKHSCVSMPSECQDSLIHRSSSDCPRIIPALLDPTPSGIYQDITVSLANVSPYQEEDLECTFGPDRIFEARWLNSSTVECTKVLLHTAEKDHLFPLSLQLKNKPGRFLDSPDLMTVSVYNCASGSADCSQCMGREDLGHHCTWSESTSSCRLNTESQLTAITCPSPEIKKIDPLNGPLEGGTLLTIRGNNLGQRFADIEDAVRVGSVKCTPLPEQYLVSVQIVCRTGGVPSILSAPVTVNVSKDGKSEGRSREQYSYMVPELYSLQPTEGPLAGGTRVTFTGKSLSVGSELRVLVNGGRECTRLVRTDSSITCTMPAMELPTPDATSVCVQLERQSCINASLVFNYRKNPQIYSFSPTSSHISGGRLITLVGEGFDIIQNMSMVVHSVGKERTNCVVVSPTTITCPSPTASSSTSGDNPALVDFFMNGILYQDNNPKAEEYMYPAGVAHSSRFSMEYHPDPQIYTAKKEKLIKHHAGEPLTLVIHKEPDNLGLRLEEYRVKIGLTSCEMNFIVVDKVIHCSVNDSLSTSDRHLPVTVQVGKFNQTIAMLQLGGSETAIIVSIVICSILLLLSVVALFVFCTKSRRAERYWQKTLVQMEEMESQIREEIRKGFAELQTDMTDLTKELNRSQGIPFLEYKHFVTRTFFPKCSSLNEEQYILPSQVGSQAQETHPLLLGEWKVPESCRTNMEEGIALFSTLLNNKHFLVTFVHALEHQKDFAVRDRCNLASLLTIALHGKLEYYTSIMKDLLVDLIDASASKNPKLMLRRTESVVEKMLTNWMSICMYSCLKETVGEPFFLLLCAIKQQVNKGSIDALTGKARYTLNEEWLLRENIEAKPLNLNVSFQGCGMDSLTVRVMDMDSVSQMKDKILEAFCKNLPFSQWPRVEDVELEWFAATGSYILRDLDDTSLMEDGRKKLNTIAHYQIPEGASLAMSLKDHRDDTLGRVKDLDTEKYFHLVLPIDDYGDTRKNHKQSHKKKVLPEIYLTRLLSTKGTLQKFLDDLFKAILSIREDRPPLAIKYFFDFLEEQAEKRGISDPETLHIWKTNSLPLRFWVNILKNPQFVFDIEKTDHMDACLSVIAQAFIDACSISNMQLGKDSPTNKLLYAKEIPEYRKIVQRYYKQIKEMPPLSDQEMNAHLAEESRNYRNEFNTKVAMAGVYRYAKKYRNQIVTALEANPTTKRTQLQYKFEQVIALMEDNIYESYSEA